MKTILADLELAKQYSQFEEQKKIFGNALKRPLPISTPNSVNFSPDSIQLDPFYFADSEPGSLPSSPEFSKWVKFLVKEGDQESQLGAVYDVSGAGKSKVILLLSLLILFKTCFTYCMENGGLFIKQGTMSLNTLCESLKALQRTAEMVDIDHKNIILWAEVHNGAFRLVKLWIASYIALIRELKEVHKGSEFRRNLIMVKWRIKSLG
jgi:hypothetical protein